MFWGFGMIAEIMIGICALKLIILHEAIFPFLSLMPLAIKMWIFQKHVR